MCGGRQESYADIVGPGANQPRHRRWPPRSALRKGFAVLETLRTRLHPDLGSAEPRSSKGRGTTHSGRTTARRSGPRTSPEFSQTWPEEDQHTSAQEEQWTG